MVFRSIFVRAFVFLCLFPVSASAADGSEDLVYQVSYSGIFSAGSEMPIVDMVLQTRLPHGQDGLTEISLRASSVAYPLVESLFPMRYHFRTWTGSNPDQLVGFETCEKTRKLKHRLYLRDTSAPGVRRYDLKAGNGRQEMEQLDAGVRPRAAAGGDPLFDYLGLMQRVRTLELEERAEYRFAVTDGRNPSIYRVRVEAAPLLKRDDRSVPAWKLRFDGLRPRSDGEEEAVHRPFFVWLARAPARIPLRLEVRHTLGTFRAELKRWPERDQVARAGG
ncbi:MAG: DUF3108 domain-containing protein [Sedimenticolaceae bacterium]